MSEGERLSAGDGAPYGEAGEPVVRASGQAARGRCAYEIDASRQIVRFRMEGRVTAQDLLGAVRSSIVDPAWQPDYGRLWDGRHVGQLAVEFEALHEIRQLSEDLAARYGPGWIALVLVRDADRIFGEFVRFAFKHVQVGVFSTIESAEAWLRGDPAA